jgi:hypothetical protein
MLFAVLTGGPRTGMRHRCDGFHISKSANMALSFLPFGVIFLNAKAALT